MSAQQKKDQNFPENGKNGDFFLDSCGVIIEPRKGPQRSGPHPKNTSRKENLS